MFAAIPLEGLDGAPLWAFYLISAIFGFLLGMMFGAAVLDIRSENEGRDKANARWRAWAVSHKLARWHVDLETGDTTLVWHPKFKPKEIPEAAGDNP